MMFGSTPKTPPKAGTGVVDGRARLTAAIMMEWRAAKGAGRSTDGRAQKTRPRNETEFLDRWGALAEIEDGRCITHTQRLEPSGSGQSP